MTFKDLKPKIIKPERVPTPQCCVPVDGETHSTWREQWYSKMRPHFDPKLCQRESVIQIDGKYYCRPHAGQVALQKWLAGELVEPK